MTLVAVFCTARGEEGASLALLEASTLQQVWRTPLRGGATITAVEVALRPPDHLRPSHRRAVHMTMHCTALVHGTTQSFVSVYCVSPAPPHTVTPVGGFRLPHPSSAHGVLGAHRLVTASRESCLVSVLGWVTTAADQISLGVLSELQISASNQMQVKSLPCWTH